MLAVKWGARVSPQSSPQVRPRSERGQRKGTRIVMASRHAGCVALAGLLMGACAGNSVTGVGPHENTGTVAGVVGGAVVGSQFGRGSGRVASTIAGAAIGGLIGNRIGAALDEEDRMRAYEAQMRALETGASGAPVGWRNDNSGRRGTVVPGPAYQRNA